MLVSGNNLPVLSGFIDNAPGQPSFDRRQSQPDRGLDTDQRNRQQTVEYIFRGDLENEIDFRNEDRSTYAQSIDPANQRAISAYNDVDSDTAANTRQGGLVNLFI